MTALVYDGLRGAAAVLMGLGIFLISLAALDLASWLTAWIVSALSLSRIRAAQVRSALATADEHRV